MKFRTDFVTNSSSSCFVLSRKSLTEGLKKYPLPVEVPDEGPLPVETVYKLLRELYASFIEPCEQVLRDFPVAPEEVKEYILRHYFYWDTKKINEDHILMALGALVEEKVRDAGQEELFQERYGMDTYFFENVLEKVHSFQKGWGNQKTYEEAQKENASGDDELPFALLDYTKDERNFLDGDFPTYFGTPCDTCRFGKSGCTEPVPLCYGDVGVDSWDGDMPYPVTDALMRYCVCGGNHLW